MNIYTVDKTNFENFTAVAPINLLCELELSNQYAFGAVVSEADKATTATLQVDKDHNQGASDYAAGLILYYFNPLSRRIIIKWLYVADEYEMRGIGTSLLQAVRKIAIENNCTKLAVSIPAKELNYELCTYFEEQGFEVTEGTSQVYFCNLQDILDNPGLSEIKLTNHVRAMTEEKSIEKLAKYIYANPEMFCDEIALEPADLIKNASSILCDRDINCEYIDDDGRILGCFIIVNNTENSVSPIFICNSKAEDVKILLEMIYFSAIQASKKYGNDLEIFFRVSTLLAKKMAKIILGEDTSIEYSEYVCDIIQ